jgi:cell division protein FtsW (lipid II flippase)
MLAQLRHLRRVELRLMLTVLLFFAAGYLLATITTSANEMNISFSDAVNILWPSTLPFFLLFAISFGLSWRSPRCDELLLPLVALLSGLGLLMNARLKPDLDAILCKAEVDDIVQLVPCYGDVAAKQSLWVTIGIVFLAAMIFVPWDRIFISYLRTSLMDWLSHNRYVWMALGLGLMVATFVFGVDPNGSGVRVWFNLGFFLFQPSELLKILLVIFLASYLDEHRAVSEMNYQLGPLTLPPLPYLVPLVGMWGISMLVIVFQRDLGAALLLFGVFLAMLYVATGRGLYVLGGVGAFGIGSLILYQLLPIVKLRVSVWLSPWETAQGSGYQIVQAMYAIASGNIFGTGLGLGSPTTVPAVHTDYIFTAIGEEFGLIGTIGVLIAYLLLIFRGFHIAQSVPGNFRGFEQLLAVGLTSILAVQTLIILGGNLRLFPLTGITLPFISYGGSSVLMNFLIVGLLMRISVGSKS